MAERWFGPYRLEQRIGRGGMGEVYRAFDSRRHRTVALKILRNELGDDEEFRERFRREAYVAARLQEPHIVPIHDFGEIDGTLFIDMRLVAGQDVSDALGRSGPMALPQAVAVLTQIADALDAAHAEGVVHRDVKPSNILLTPSGFAYLADFGIARAVSESTSSLTATGATMGTTSYMAPELFEGSRIDGRADVYALACVFHELVTGEPPFRGRTPLALLHAHLATPPPRVTALRPDLPPGLDDVVVRGLAKQPHHRFPTAGEFAQAVLGALRPVAAPSTATSPGGTPRPARRIWWVLVAVVSVLAVAATSALVAATVARDGSTATAQPVAGPLPSAATGPPTATPTATSTAITAANRELITAVDPAILQECRSGNPTAYVGAVASISCTNPEEQPRTRTALVRLATPADLDVALARETTIEASGTAGYDQNCIAAALIDVWDRGRVVCGPVKTPTDGTRIRIAWTFDAELVIAYTEGDAAPFYEWWVRSRSLLR